MSDERDDERYSMIIEWEPEDRIYVVTVPELPGCLTHGETLEEAVQQGRDAITTWIDGMRHWGQPIPPPRYFKLEATDQLAKEPLGATA